MLHLELENVFLGGIKRSVKQDGSVAIYLTFTNSDGSIIKANVSEATPDLEDFIFQPVNGKLKDIAYLGNDKGVLIVRASSFELVNNS